MEPHRKIRIGVLTSSRAEFGIYQPLLNRLKLEENVFDLAIIVFGTHLSSFHDKTANQIISEGFQIAYSVPSMLLTDDEESISTAYALTTLKFSSFWAMNHNQFDWVLCIGDRYEMAAAVAAGIPFGIRFAHIGGGDTTKGAIDNIYRHFITLTSSLHFVSLEPFAEQVKCLMGPNVNCIVTGSLSLDNLDQIKLLDKKSFSEKWNINVQIPFILVTVHPETVNPQNNKKHIKTIISALKILAKESNLVITMPNSDTEGSSYRFAFKKIREELEEGKVILIENFGTQSYFSAMSYADYLIGNTSSGIVEAASFRKYVINIGDRQKGRIAGENVIHVPFDADSIVNAAINVKGKVFNGTNIYKKENAAKLITQALQKWN